MRYEAEHDPWLQEEGETCVYGLYRQAGTPFYVGEGIPDRPFQHLAHARNNRPGYLYHQMRDMWSRGEAVRVRKLYEGLAKWRARDLENALIREFLKEFGPGVLFNHNGKYLSGGREPSPEAVARVRRDKHLWRLPAFTPKEQTA
jgi:hypothetical protein